MCSIFIRFLFLFVGGLGGGQDAMDVTMIECRAGKFVAKFYHKVNSTEQVEKVFVGQT